MKAMTIAPRREICFFPAWDKRSDDPKKNYGIHGVELRFHLVGPDLAVQFVLYTNWQLPHVREELDAKTTNPCYPHLLCHPMAADLGYHSRTPRYDDQKPMLGSCDLLGGAPCYYDGSALNAERIYDVLLREGDKGVWRELQAYYESLLAEAT